MKKSYICNIVAKDTMMMCLLQRLLLMIAVSIIFSCAIEDPPPIENEEEIITDVILKFTLASGGASITVIASDPDGEGPQDLETIDNINLLAGMTYVLNIEAENSVAGSSITEEIANEGDEHQFFFQWTPGIFSDPVGNGNADNRNDPVNYNDADANGLPLGLSTIWTTGNGTTGSQFRVVLKHQPDIKSASSDIHTGDTDIDLTWAISIQ